VYDAASQKLAAIDGGVQVPRGARDDMFELQEPGSIGPGVYGWRGTVGDAAESGHRSAIVPGAVAAYTTLLETFGTMPLEEVMVPAILLAAEGFALDWYVFANCAAQLARLRRFPETLAVFYRPDGTPFLPVNHDDNRKPDRLVQTDLAGTLQLIAKEGADAFYRGQISRAIAEHITAHGGSISREDLAEYQAVVREPLMIDYRGRRVTFVPEYGGGPTAAQALNLLEGFDLATLGHNSTATLHLVAEACRLAFADRFAYLSDPAFGPIPLQGLQSKAYAAERRRAIDQARGPAPQPAGDPWPYSPGDRPAELAPPQDGHPSGGHTTHLCVIDRHRNMVALTASLGQLFGSGVVVPGTGVLLNNGMMWFDPEPGRVNSIAPGKRCLGASTPTLVFDEYGPLMALGAPGGRKVITAVLQVLLNVLDFGLGMQEAIAAPRIHCETGPVHADVRLPVDVIDGLRRIGYEVVTREETFLSSYFARPNGILIDRTNGVLHSGVEPYKLAAATGF